MTFLRSYSYVSQFFYTDNVEILLKRTEDLGIYQRHRISSECFFWDQTTGIYSSPVFTLKQHQTTVKVQMIIYM